MTQNSASFGPALYSGGKNNDGAPFIKFQIKNTIRILSDDLAETRLDADGIERKHVFDWHVYMDILEGNPKILARVEVDMGPEFRRVRHYVWNRPIKVIAELDNGVNNNNDDQHHLWRCFSSRQKCWGWPETIRFRLVGIGGEVLPIKYHAYEERSESIIGHFFEMNPHPSKSFLMPLTLPGNIGYTLFLQDAIVGGTPVALCVQDVSHLTQGQVEYRDKSMLENRKVLDTFNGTIAFNLYITIESISLNDYEGALKVCQNFIKYEQALDDLTSIDSETLTSSNSDRYKNVARSNRDTIEGETNKSKHDRLASCSSIQELVETMNPNPNALYKLKLLQSDCGTISTQFVVTSMKHDNDLLDAWIRTFVLFVYNSIRLRKPKSIKSTRSLAEQKEMLFAHVIRDRYVEEILLKQSISDAESVLSFKSQLDELDVSRDDDGWSLPESVVPMEDSQSSAQLSSKRSYWNYECNLEDYCSRKLPRLEEDETRSGFLTSPLSARSLCHDNIQHSTTADSLILEAIHAPPVVPPSNALTVMLRSHTADKNLTCNQLDCILKKLNAARRNRKKGLLVKELGGYFDARSAEIVEYFRSEEAKREYQDGMPSGWMLGIEILTERQRDGNDTSVDASLDSDNNQTTSELLTVILRGGRKKLVRPRKSVCTPANHLISILDLALKDLTSICTKLHLFDVDVPPQQENAISVFNAYLDSLGMFSQTSQSGPPCRFAIAHDLYYANNSQVGAI
jgi:hypothetical protein